MKAPKNKKIPFFIQIMKYVGMLAVFTVVTLFLYLGTDTLCNLLYRWTGKENFSQEYIRTKLLQVVMEGSARQRIMESETNVNNFSIHPYTGYVTNIDMPSDNIVNRFGWIGPDPLKIHDENTVTVFVTGGSFALGLYLQSGDLLKQLLEELPMYQGKHILVTSVALGGYKQPQQLLALQYLMALGAQIDLVINIDGYNEVVLPKVESIPFGITPSYPRSWKFIADKIVRPGFLDKQKFMTNCGISGSKMPGCGISVVSGIIWFRLCCGIL